MVISSTNLTTKTSELTRLLLTFLFVCNVIARFQLRIYLDMKVTEYLHSREYNIFYYTFSKY